MSVIGAVPSGRTARRPAWPERRRVIVTARTSPAGMTFTIGPETAALFMLVFARVGVLMMLLPGVRRALHAGARAPRARRVPHPRHGAHRAPAAAAGRSHPAQRRRRASPRDRHRPDDRAHRAAGRGEPADGGQLRVPVARPRLRRDGRSLPGRAGRRGGQPAHAARRRAHLRHRRASPRAGRIGGSYAVLPPGLAPATGDAAKLALTTMASGSASRCKSPRPSSSSASSSTSASASCRGSCPRCRCSSSRAGDDHPGFMIMFAVVGLMMTTFLREVGNLMRPFAGG